MNRYQQQVAEMDARHHWRVRVMTFAGAATLIIVVLWAADFRLGAFDAARWWQDVRHWIDQRWQADSKEVHHTTAPQLPRPVTVDGKTQSKEPLKPLMGTDSSVSKVPLPLLLVRTEPGRNVREGKALLGVARENPQTYSGGALLANGARIAEIYADHVVLERNGKSVKLYVDGNKQNAKALNDLLTVGGQSEMKLAVATSHEILTDYLRPSPVYDGQILKGYQVYAGQRAGVFSQLGLQNGDLIVALNDQPFVDPKQAMELFQQLTSGFAIAANVERKGQVERISLDGALITADQERINNPPPQPVTPMGPGM